MGVFVNELMAILGNINTGIIVIMTLPVEKNTTENSKPNGSDSLSVKTQKSWRGIFQYVEC